MSDEERQRWDERYASGEYPARTQPSPFLVEWLPRVTPGRALDIATGIGRHALYLASHGWQVDAVDISSVAIETAAAEAERIDVDVDFHVLDLDDAPLPGDGYDLITVFRYRSQDLWPRLAAALAPDGWILMEHHMQARTDVVGPPEHFRLAPGELLDAFGHLRVLHYSETLEAADNEAGTFAIARLAACGDPGW